MQPAEYRALVAAESTRLAGQPGDAFFAWLVPEPSHMDNDYVSRLLRIGVVSPEFVAAVLALDLETPILSPERASLLRFVPERFRFKRLSGGSLTNPTAPRDALTEAVIANIQASNPAPNSTPAKFLQLLRAIDEQNPQSPQNPRKVLESRVNAYQARVGGLLANPQTRPAELTRLYKRAIAMRQAVLADPTMSVLNEAGDRLLPLL